MENASLKPTIMHVLNELEEDQFKDFCIKLRRTDPSKFSYNLHHKRTREVVDEMLRNYEGPAVLVKIISILIEMKQKDLAVELETLCMSAKPGDIYPMESKPRGICLIVNNTVFEKGSTRVGSQKDVEALTQVFYWLGFRVLKCDNLTKEQMKNAFDYFSTLSDNTMLRKFNVKEWSQTQRIFHDVQLPLKHGDAFVCSVLSHGAEGVVFGTDMHEMSIKTITRTFRASRSSPLLGKPKVFLIQACQRSRIQSGVPVADADEYIPELADFLVAVATVEDHVSNKNTINGTWFIQAVCEELKKGCLKYEAMNVILERVISDVSKKHAASREEKQIPEVHYTLRKKLILTPVNK